MAALRRASAVLGFALLLSPFVPISSYAQPNGRELPFVFWGAVYLADPHALAVSEVGRISPAAPMVDWGPDGLLWGRVDPNFLGALDPATGRVVATVPLRFRPYDYVVAPNGTAYVSHNALTERGFTVSVVDLRSRKLVAEITGIEGLRLSILYAEGHVYLTALGVGADNRFDLYLYDINTSDNSLRELRHLRGGKTTWRLLSASGVAYLLTLPTGDAAAPYRLEAINSSAARAARVLSATAFNSGRRPVELLGMDGESPVMICRLADGGYEFDWLDSAFSTVVSAVPIPGPLTSIVGLRGDVLVYLDNGSRRGSQDASLCFFDIRERKEVKRIRISS